MGVGLPETPRVTSPEAALDPDLDVTVKTEPLRRGGELPAETVQNTAQNVPNGKAWGWWKNHGTFTLPQIGRAQDPFETDRERDERRAEERRADERRSNQTRRAAQNRNILLRQVPQIVRTVLSELIPQGRRSEGRVVPQPSQTATNPGQQTAPASPRGQQPAASVFYHALILNSEAIILPQTDCLICN